MAGPLLLPGHRLGEPLPSRVVIVRALPGLGDFLCWVPAVRAIRRALPEAEITLVGLPSVAPLRARFRAYLDAFLPFPGYPGIEEAPAQPARFPAFLTKAQGHGFDLAIQMHGNGTIMNAFTVLLGARLNAGFYRRGFYCPDAVRFLPYPIHEPEIRRHCLLMEFLGIPNAGEHLEFPVTGEDRARLAELPEAARLPLGSYICIHPGASTESRCWAPEEFAQVADGLAAQGLHVVLTGSAADAPRTAAVARAMRAPALDLAGATSLGALAALMEGARLLVSNDTGVSHLAVALRVPSVVVFTGSDPARWAPLDGRRHRAIVSAMMPDPETVDGLGGDREAPARARAASRVPAAALVPGRLNPVHVLGEATALLGSRL